MRIDPSAIQRLKDLGADVGENLLGEIIRIFFETGPIAMKSLQSAADKKDYSDLNQLAHSFKSTCANIGADTLRDLMARLENSQSNDEFKKVPELLDEAREEFKMVCLELAKHDSA